MLLTITAKRNSERLAEPGPFLSPAVCDQIDDLFVGQVTQPETLVGLCDGIDVVFSSVGLTRQKDNLTFHDVDYQGNKNILGRNLVHIHWRTIFGSWDDHPILDLLRGARGQQT